MVIVVAGGGDDDGNHDGDDDGMTVVVAYLQTSWAIPPRRTHTAKSTDHVK